MSTVDASIPLGVRPFQVEQPVNQLAKILQIQHYQQQNQLGQMQMDKYKQDLEDTNALRTALSAPDADPYKVLLQRGKVKEAVDFQKGTTEAAKHKVDLVDAKLKQSRQFLDTVKTPEEYLAWHKANHSDPILGPELASRGVTADQAMARIQQALQVPGGFQRLLQESALGLEKFTELNKPTTNVVNTGGTTQMVQTPGLGGAPTVAGTFTNTVTPDAVMTDRRTREEGAANRGVTIRGQNLTDARQREFNQTQAGQKTQQGVIELRKEFNALPEVKNFREVLPIIQSVQRAPDTPAGDIDLIYGVGKVMDPNSVVREGEMNLVIKSGSPAQRLQGYVNYVKGGGRLSPAQRQELMQVMESRVQGLRTNYDNARRTFETAADRGGLPKDQIFIENPVPPPVVDLHNVPKGGRASGGKVVDFGSLK